ncbi:hypothetical protein LOTGIDRAFT_119495 [Lottia gigantea]|uniref:Tyrosine--tRNA ligase n=1 Tax=Lottia gigantea TaxID=225164 RepID=V4AII1_LOTGI|nr:hypothetical protein LOTGIDRAFT_119495 [Lottia gigantea]ESO93286.1 hypothetical protein LOTGIDRAFT_119495 [Lottia gigantea]
MTNDIKLLYCRGPALYDKLSSTQCIYCGFDPTADSLHIGNLLAIIGLIHAHRYGHMAVALVGGATAQIGDPSGRTKERDRIDLHDVERNVEKLTENLQRIFDNHSTCFLPRSHNLENIRIVNNISWYQNKNVIDFLSKEGKKFRMNAMLNKSSVQSRLSKPEGMNFSEFTYQIFQSYDWYQLYKNYKCTIQIGGSDQLGNITAGFDFLLKQVDEDSFFGLTIPLITASSGEKLGKSTGNSLWLDPYKTSAYQLYQYFFNFADSDVEEYLNLFTFLTDQEITQILEEHQSAPHKRLAQKRLGENVTLLVHGEKGLNTAKKWTDVLFGGTVELLQTLTKDDLQHSPELLVTEVPVSDKTNLKHLCIDYLKVHPCKYFDKILNTGGLHINYERVNDNITIDDSHILPNNITMIQLGKKNHYLLKWSDG